MSEKIPEMSNPQDVKATEITTSSSLESAPDNSESLAASIFSTSGISTWAKNIVKSHDGSSSGNSEMSPLARLTSGLGFRSAPVSPQSDESSDGAFPTTPSGFIETITKGLVDASNSAVKAVQVKARHVVSQNKRRYQEGGFDLDMTYITENIIAMGFPAGDLSSGFFGYVEGLYRNHMEEVIQFFETYHKDKYKVYNLCSERLYDASLFEGKVATFPFDDHNCPPIQLIISFCQSAYSWLKEDIENVVVVHCKAGMARTGLMISSLLLYLKFFPTAEESIDYFNQKRCIDGKGLVLPSQIRYVKYFERILAYFNGENQPSRRCILRGFRLHKCPYWIKPSITVSDHNGVLFSTKKHPRTNNLSPEDFWFSAPKKGVTVFALPGEPGLTEIAGDFKIHFHDHLGDFYCWLNTTMIENRKVLSTSDLDGFDKRKLLSPGFQVEVVLVDCDPASDSARPPSGNSTCELEKASRPNVRPVDERVAAKGQSKDKDDELSDNETDENGVSRPRPTDATINAEDGISNISSSQIANLAHKAEQVSSGTSASTHGEPNKETFSGHHASGAVGEVSEFKAMAADASVFSFGDDEDYESE